MSTINRSTTQAHDAQVIAGIKKDLQATTTLLLAGSSYTPTSLVALVQSRIDQASKVAIARASWLAEVATFQKLNAQVAPVVRGLRQYVVNAYGETSPVLADFAFTPTKRATQTAEDKATAAVKRKETRTLRGTKGKKAKLAIKATSVPATPPAPTAPAASVPTTAAPAPATPAPVAVPVTTPHTSP
jgi:hypothetical protein